MQLSVLMADTFKRGYYLDQSFDPEVMTSLLQIYKKLWEGEDVLQNCFGHLAS